MIKDLLSGLTSVDPTDYRHLYDTSTEDGVVPGGGVHVTFLGVSTLLLADDENTIMTDGFFSRPGLLRARFGRLTTNRARVAGALARIGLTDLDALFVAHSHVDHALDAAEVAGRTGASLHGSTSTRRIAEAQNFDPTRFRPIETGQPVQVGRFTVTAIPAQHSPGDLAPGHIEHPVSSSPRLTDLKTGDCYSFHVAHPDGALLIHASANFLPGVLTPFPVDTVYLGIGALGHQTEEFRDAYWREVVEATGARRVVPIHWDNFTRALTRPVRTLPRRFDDFETSVRHLERRCAETGVLLVLPQVWQRTNPFA
ncbi:MBL fold metallo-hydrolase [Aeromicrobium sp. CF3.5]|uniref:MBL fold metallo-hydrolase n=1 Tax=Aeromicrobium sp. CF3.5 TaxID=3373078 RepID=UPI003EE475F5